MADSRVDGYSWMYVMDVGSGTATACFNNGNDTWDNNSEKNYTIKAGVNSFGGTSLKLSSVTIANNTKGKQCNFTVKISGGIAPYFLDYTIKRKSDDSVVEEKTGVALETKSYEFSTEVEEMGEYTISVSVKDAYGQTASKTLDFEVEGFEISNIKTRLASPQLSGTEIVLTDQRKNAYVTGEEIKSKWTIKNNTTGTTKEEIVSDSNVLRWTPEEIGEYEITVETTDNAGETATYTIYYLIVEKIINKAVIYYANSSWSKAYIYYQMGTGEWTTVPGVAMEANSEQSGYTWNYTLELGEETSAKVCFNNGNDSWDNKDSSNYTVGVGTYGIKNTTITPLTPVATPTPTLQLEIVTTNTIVSIATNGMKIQIGDIITDSVSKATFQVTSNGSKSKTVEYVVSAATADLIVIPDIVEIDGKQYKVTSIAMNAFRNNKNVKSIVIGKNVKNIGTKAFYGCKKLKMVSGGKNVTNIGSQAFYKCISLTSVAMSSKMTTIGKQAFYKCTKLTKITIPSKVSKIGSQAFYGCKKLKTITIKTKKLTSKKVGSKAFKGIYEKATIKVPSSKLKTYKKVLRSKGVSAKAKIKK